MLIETLLGGAVGIAGVLSIIHWLRDDPMNLFVLLGVALLFGALHSCAPSVCGDIGDCIIHR